MPSGRLTFFRKSEGRMGSSQIISGSGVGLGLGTKVDVVVGGTEVAGKEVGGKLGAEVTVS